MDTSTALLSSKLDVTALYCKDVGDLVIDSWCVIYEHHSDSNVKATATAHKHVTKPCFFKSSDISLRSKVGN